MTILKASVLALAAASKWDDHNDPGIFGEYENNLGKLKTSAATKVTPWSDTYWPSNQGGIANRWQSDKPEDPNNGFDYTLHKLDELKKMASWEIAALSPSEKFDILNSRYDYPLTSGEWQRCSPKQAYWEGICHGWCPAADEFAEPSPVSLANDDGIAVEFGSSDVKALLSYYAGQYDTDCPNVLFLAQRCDIDLDEHPEDASEAACVDINAAALHLVLANRVGDEGKPFVGDLTRDVEVWNQPVFKYAMVLGETRDPSDGAAPKTAKEQKIDLTLSYVKETDAEWDAHEPAVYTKDYTYWLELASDSEILGGSFETFDRPDFIWTQDQNDFFGYFKKLKTIVDAKSGDFCCQSSDDDCAAGLVCCKKGCDSPATCSYAESSCKSSGSAHGCAWDGGACVVAGSALFGARNATTPARAAVEGPAALPTTTTMRAPAAFVAAAEAAALNVSLAASGSTRVWVVRGEDARALELRLSDIQLGNRFAELRVYEGTPDDLGPILAAVRGGDATVTLPATAPADALTLVFHAGPTATTAAFDAQYRVL